MCTTSWCITLYVCKRTHHQCTQPSVVCHTCPRARARARVIACRRSTTVMQANGHRLTCRGSANHHCAPASICAYVQTSKPRALPQRLCLQWVQRGRFERLMLRFLLACQKSNNPRTITKRRRDGPDSGTGHRHTHTHTQTHTRTHEAGCA